MENINNSCDFKDMPEDIIYVILLWLPVESLSRFKSVCKSWNSLIQSSKFIKQHVVHHHRDHPTSKDDFILSVTYKDEAVLLPCDGKKNYKLSNIPHPFNKLQLTGGAGSLRIQAYCNGIICISHWNCNDVYLWNPARKQCRMISEEKLIFGLKEYIQFGIGFDNKTDNYKVVRMCYADYNSSNKITNFQLKIYSVSTGSWRAREDVALPANVRIIDSTKAPVQNGQYFCWLGKDLDYVGYGEGLRCAKLHIISFDFSNEVLRFMPLPESICCRHEGVGITTLKEKLASISVLGCLADVGSWQFDIWILNEFGVKESWNKLYTIGPLPIDLIERYSLRGLYWLGFPNKEELIFQRWDRQLCLCNLTTQEIKKFQFPVSSGGDAIAFTESLVSIEIRA